MQDVPSDDVKLVLADGRHVLADGRVVSAVQVPQPAAQVHREIASGRVAARTLEKMHRKLGDLPESPIKMNPIAAIMGYSSIGLNNADIATALGATEQQIETIKGSEAYKQFTEMFDRSTFEDAKREANHIIATASTHAATTMVDSLDSSDESVRVVASREVLKLAGVGTDRADENKISGLNIKITRSGDKKNDEINVEIKHGPSN